jgi:hypothetical protein
MHDVRSRSISAGSLTGSVFFTLRALYAVLILFSVRALTHASTFLEVFTCAFTSVFLYHRTQRPVWQPVKLCLCPFRHHSNGTVLF